MKRITTLLAACVVTAAAAAEDTARIVPTRSEFPPRIDGRLSEPSWRRAAYIDNIPTPGRPVGRRTEVRLMYDETHLYAGWVCHEPEMAKRVTYHCQARDKGWGDDSVEIFVRPGVDTGPIFQVIVTSENQVADLRYETVKMPDKKWDSSARTAVRHHERSWTVEMALPWAELELSRTASSTMGINLSRWQAAAGWFGGNWARPGYAGKTIDHLGRMEGINLDFSAYTVAAESPRLLAGMCYGDNAVPVVLENRGGYPRKVRAEAQCYYVDGTPMSALPAGQEVELMPGDEKVVILSVPVTERRGHVRTLLRAVDVQTGSALSQLTRYTALPGEMLVVKPDRRYVTAGEEAMKLNVHAYLGEDSLHLYRLQVSIPSAGGSSTCTYNIRLPTRDAAVPLVTRNLPLGESEISFGLASVVSSQVLERVTEKIVRLKGPFDP